eukprot:24904_6
MRASIASLQRYSPGSNPPTRRRQSQMIGRPSDDKVNRRPQESLLAIASLLWSMQFARIHSYCIIYRRYKKERHLS